MTAHNFSTQYNTEQYYLPSYFQTNIIVQMLSVGREGVVA